ncbi:MAG: MBL fold metallo-hydrolase [Oscillospiraceae bacterium]
MVKEIIKNIWIFPIELPNNPLKQINCYVVKGEDRSLMIDTGFNLPVCWKQLRAAMNELHMIPEKTDVFLTHMHSDHSGNAKNVQELGCRLLMSPDDLQEISMEWGQNWKPVWEMSRSGGMSAGTVQATFEHNLAVECGSQPFVSEPVVNGDLLSYGDYQFVCVATPGHTPGHLCLYEKRQKLMFLGDHVLFDITPNISVWGTMKDSLGTYLDSLGKIAEYEIEIPLPGHRGTGDVSVSQRAEELIQHYKSRAAECRSVICDCPGLSTYEIAGKVHWNIRAKSWEEFPAGQKWFAFSETAAHLEYLLNRGFIRQEPDKHGVLRYYADAKN